MRMYHFTIMFAVFAIGIIVITDVRLSEKYRLDTVRIRMDALIDEAVNAAAWELRSSGTVFDSVTEERAISSFYYYLYAALGIMDLPEKRVEIQKYIPEIIITVPEGDYIYTYIHGAADADPYKNYEKSGPETGESGEVSFAACFTGYPLEYGTYSGFRVSGSYIMERKDWE